MVGKPEVMAEILSWKLLLICSSSTRNRVEAIWEQLPRSGLLARFAEFTLTRTGLLMEGVELNH